MTSATRGPNTKDAPPEVWSKYTGPVSPPPAGIPVSDPDLGPESDPGPGPDPDPGTGHATGSATGSVATAATAVDGSTGGGTARAGGPPWAGRRVAYRGGSSTSPSAGAGRLVPGTQAEPPQYRTKPGMEGSG
ncbi:MULTISPECIES: hypothetical protein [Streptomyces]|uniref:hypothetical protein n=1 Tax=Streptomyces TaxID=1883 RepID=UPI000AD0339A|nr:MULTISPECIES: hypothetical protein [Streptomyces]